MNYTLLPTEKATQIRERFEKSFIQTRNEYEIHFAEWLEEFKKSPNYNPQFPPTAKYDQVVYWSKLKNDDRDILFEDAISFISNVDSKVYFLSDIELEGYAGMHLLNDENSAIGFVAQAEDSKEFADFIYYEWRRFNDMNDFYLDKLLPDDLYVFDDSFSWMLVFTHHNVDDFGSEYVENSFNRLCFLLRA